MRGRKKLTAAVEGAYRVEIEVKAVEVEVLEVEESRDKNTRHRRSTDRWRQQNILI